MLVLSSINLYSYVDFLVNFVKLWTTITFVNLVFIHLLQGRVATEALLAPIFINFRELRIFLKHYVLFKLGCNLNDLKLYLIFIFLPFFILIGFIVTQYVALFAVLASFIYFVFVWFRRARLLNKCVNKAYDLYSSDLSLKNYLKRDYHSFLISMICLKHAVKQNGVFLGRLNGFDRVFLSRPDEGSKLFVKYLEWENTFNKNLQATEEFKDLGLGDKKRVLEETAYVFRGLLEHAQVALMVDKDSAGPTFAFPLTTIEKNPIYLAKQQEELLLIIEGRLTGVFPELVPLFERWSANNAGRTQGMVTGYSIFYEREKERIVWSESKPKSFNERFLEKSSVDSINRSLEVYENPIKEILNSGIGPTPGVKLVVKPTLGVFGDVI